MFVEDYEEPPLEALSYLTGECNYGGRVTDDHDRRLIMSLLSIFYSRRTIEDQAYRFSESGLYRVPEKGSYEGYIEYFRGLPQTPQPEASDVTLTTF